MIRALLVCLAVSGCAISSDKNLEIAFQSINAMDAYTTSRIRHTPGVMESNPLTRSLIGSQPNSNDVVLLFIAYGIGHYMISKSLPPKWRRYFQVATILYSGSLVINNCKLDLC